VIFILGDAAKTGLFVFAIPEHASNGCISAKPVHLPSERISAETDFMPFCRFGPGFSKIGAFQLCHLSTWPDFLSNRYGSPRLEHFQISTRLPTVRLNEWGAERVQVLSVFQF